MAAADVRGVEVDTARIDKDIHTYRRGHGPGEEFDHAPHSTRTRVWIKRPPMYVCVVHLVYEVREDRKKPKMRRQWVWATPEGPDKASRYPLAVPFAQELARVIGQPCRVIEPEDDPA